MSREVLLVGSVPLTPASRVFETVAGHLGTLAPRIPDGEQIGWLLAAFRSFAKHPALEVSRQVPLDAGGRVPLNIYRLKVSALKQGEYTFLAPLSPGMPPLLNRAFTFGVE